MADIGALFSAAIAGNVKAIAMLEMEAEERSTILHTEAKRGNTEHVRYIVRNIANKKNLWLKLDWMNQTALHHAVNNGQCHVVEVLIDGARQFFQYNYVSSSFPANDPHKSVTSFQAYIRHVNIDSATALSYGVMRGCLRCVKMLVEADPTDRHTKFQDDIKLELIDIRSLNNKGKSPMYAAAEKGYNDIVKTICKTCTAPSLDGPGGSTALHAAIKHLNQAKEKDADVIRMIINAAKRSCTPPYGSFEDLFNQTDESAHTVLELAVKGNLVNVVDLILKENPAYQRSTILHTEAERGNTEHVRFIVRNNANKNNLWVKLDEANQTALHYAVCSGQPDVLEVLINGARQFFQDNNASSFPANDEDPHKSVSSFQAYIRQVNTDSATALSYGVKNGYMRCVKMLVEADPTDRHTKYQGKSPMYIAAEEGYNDIVKMICTTCMAPSLDGPRGSTALHAAIKHLNKVKKKDTDVIRMIMDAAKRSCTPPYVSFEDLFNQTDEFGHTVLELALIGNQENVVDLILKEDPAYQHSGRSEADEEYTNIVELLSKTCDHFRRKFYALILAIKRRDKDSVLPLLRYDNHLATFAEDEGWTPLHYAAYHEFDSILDTIIKAQKELGYQFVYKDKVQTPLLVAAEKGYTSTVIRLMELWPTSSSAYTAINNNGQNILHLAAAENKKEMIEGILKYCPEKYKDTLLKQQDANGDTPLHLLISHGCFIPKLIKHKGLDTMVRNKRNWTPRDMLYSTDDIIADQVKIKIALDDVQTNQSRKFWRKNMKKKTDILESLVPPSKREAKDVKFNEKAKVLIDENREQIKNGLERYKQRTSTQIIVAALITTVTFTVGFTMPGGLRQSGEVNEGLVVLIKRTAFNAFMVSDALAFLLSTCSLFLYFLESMYEDPHQVSILNAASVVLNIISVMAMMLTFITGTYVVLSHSPALAVTVCLIGSFFFIFVIVLLIKMVYDRQVKRNHED